MSYVGAGDDGDDGMAGAATWRAPLAGTDRHPPPGQCTDGPVAADGAAPGAADPVPAVGTGLPLAQEVTAASTRMRRAARAAGEETVTGRIMITSRPGACPSQLPRRAGELSPAW